MRSLSWAVTLLACTLTGSLLPGGGTLLRPHRIGPSCGVRALAKGKSKRQGKAKAPSGGGKASPKGFGAPPPPPPPPPPPLPPARAAAASGADADADGGGGPQLVAVDLGAGKQVSVMIPPQAQEPSEAELLRLETSTDAEAQRGVLGAYTHLYGAGDVVWPASVALARLLAHVPSFSAEQRVLELGCGLGAVGLAAGTAGAATVLLTDREAPLLALAAQAADANGLAGVVSTATLEWDADEAALRSAIGDEPFDLVVGADLLYDDGAARMLAALLAQLLDPTASALMPAETAAAAFAQPARALLSDPKQRNHRAAFTQACAEEGLDVSDDALPGPEGARLLTVTVAAEEEEEEGDDDDDGVWFGDDDDDEDEEEVQAVQAVEAVEDGMKGGQDGKKDRQEDGGEEAAAEGEEGRQEAGGEAAAEGEAAAAVRATAEAEMAFALQVVSALQQPAAAGLPFLRRADLGFVRLGELADLTTAAPSAMAGAGTGLHARAAVEAGTVVCLYPVVRAS